MVGGVPVVGYWNFSCFHCFYQIFGTFELRIFVKHRLNHQRPDKQAARFFSVVNNKHFLTRARFHMLRYLIATIWFVISSTHVFCREFVINPATGELRAQGALSDSSPRVIYVTATGTVRYQIEKNSTVSIDVWIYRQRHTTHVISGTGHGQRDKLQSAK